MGGLMYLLVRMAGSALVGLLTLPAVVASVLWGKWRALRRRRAEQWAPAPCDHLLDRDDARCVYCGADPWEEPVRPPST